MASYAIDNEQYRKYRRKDLEVHSYGIKVKLIKKELSSQIGGKEIELIHNNILLENYQMIKNYNIPFEDDIWFGEIEEYNEEFGEHVLVVLKANYSTDAKALTEKILVKKTDTIFFIRSSFIKMYSWIEKVKFWNWNKELLTDDKTIEESGLVDNPIIIVQSQKLVPVTGLEKITNLSFHQNNNENFFTEDESMGLSNIMGYIDPLSELTAKHLDARTNDGPSNMSQLLALRNKTVDEVNQANPDLSKMITGIFSELGQTNRTPPNEDLAKNLNSIFSGCIDPPEDNENAINLDDAMGSAIQFFEKACKIRETQLMTNAERTEHELVKKLFNSLFNAIPKNEDTNDKFDRRILDRLNVLTDKALTSQGPIDGYKLAQEMRSNLDRDKSSIGFDMGSTINDMSMMFQNFNQFGCHNININTNMNKDDPLYISSATPLTGSDIKTIISKDNDGKKVYLADETYENVYGESDKFSNTIISSFTVSKLDHLEKSEYIGEGSFGEVWKYKNKSTGQSCVLKQIPIFGKNLEDIKEMFKEIATFSKLGLHHRIIQYFEYYNDENYFYIEMEFLAGGSLSEYIDKNQPLSQWKIKHFTQQILQGIKYLHDKSIRHGDISSDNILLDENEDVKLTDFGLSTCFNKSRENFLKGTKQSGNGRERYMAPEMQNYLSIYGAPADIWAFGIVMLDMVTGDCQCSDIDKLRMDAVENVIGMADSLSKFIEACLVKDPEKRSTAAQLLLFEFILYEN